MKVNKLFGVWKGGKIGGARKPLKLLGMYSTKAEAEKAATNLNKRGYVAQDGRISPGQLP